MSPPLSTTKSASLHPVVQAVLSSLDVQLEVEMSLYRCHQAVRRSPPLARQVSQDQTSKSDQSLNKTELAATTQLTENTHSNLDNLVNNSQPAINSDSALTLSTFQKVSLLKSTDSSLTLEAYLQFSQAQLKNLEKTKVAKSRFPQNLLKPLAIAAASLLLSIPLSYLMINWIVNSTGLNGVGSKACPAAEMPRHFCNSSSSLGDR